MITFHSNAVALTLHGLYYAPPTSVTTSPKLTILPPCDEKDAKSSYHVFALRRVATSQCRRNVVSVRKLIKNLIIRRRETSQLEVEVEDHQARVTHLRDLLQQEKFQLSNERELASSLLQQQEADLASRQENLKQDRSSHSESYNSYRLVKEHAAQIASQLGLRRRDILSELSHIFPISSTIDTNIKSQKIAQSCEVHTICAVKLPDSENFSSKEDLQTSVALGYTCQLLLMMSQFLLLPLRYPIILKGSMSSIVDHATDKLSDKERLLNEFFLQIRLEMKLVFLLTTMLLASAQRRSQLSFLQILDLHYCHYYSPRCNQSSEFNCGCEDDAIGDSRDCIPQSWVCDGQRDCLNGADEIDCRCNPGEYQCYGGGSVRFYQCINESEVCNGMWPDCVNWRDEYHEKCRGGFQCKNGLYLRASRKCDGDDHCGDYSDEDNCGYVDCPRRQHRCDCYKEGNITCGDGERCYHDLIKCDGVANCPDGSDEWNCSSCPMRKPFHCACNKVDHYSCKEKGFKCDGYAQCEDGSDEWNCSSCSTWGPLQCACNNIDDYSCKGKGPVCYKHDEKCNGNAICPDGSDERNCSSCSSLGTLCCACNEIDDNSCGGRGPVRYKHGEKCSTVIICQDSSDEMNCTCPEDKFTCSCFRKNSPTCDTKAGCIPIEYVNDGKLDCFSGNDEQYIKSWDKMSWDFCNFGIFRLYNERFCVLSWCDNSTCTNVPSLECSKYDCNMTDAVCFSFCSDKKTSAGNNTIFQCTDQSIILNQNFCNGKEDCNDGTDEITSKPGFKCSAKFSTILCVLPQWNLYDDIAQCFDNSDLCFSSDGSFHCFKCLDNRLIISPKQVCDGVIDCFDLSDECLCENPSLPECLDIFSKSRQCSFSMDANNTSSNSCSGEDCENIRKVNQKLIRCNNKWGKTYAILCDGRPECIDFADECKSCPNTPAFCNDTCRTYFTMGDRYCDGYIDEAWNYLQDTKCSLGFDERNCLKRFQCKAGEKHSIDVLQKCDGMENCEARIDEKNCSNRHYCMTKAGNLTSIPKSLVLNGKQDCVDGSDEFFPGIFSSAREMIDNLGLKIWLWFITILTILGNFYVAILSIRHLHEGKNRSASLCNHILIINLSVSDCLMGVYLMIILVKDVQFAGRYSEFDYEWRSSTICSLAGSLCVISSQTSCFLMAILTDYRLYAVLYPFKARNASAKPWIVVAMCSWIISIIIAVVSNTTRYFKSKIIFLNEFSLSDTVTHDYVTDFACRLVILTNTSQDLNESSWQSVKSFLNNKFPQYAPIGEIGYYGTTSVCMPRLYVNRSDVFWIYSIVIVTFNFLSFLFVLSGFALIAWKMKKRPIKSDNAQKQNSKMNQRIARIIVSDFLCWVPICVMAYISVSGVKLPDGVEIFTAGVLLPINSAFNPILYSPYIETKVEYLWKRIRPNCNQTLQHRCDRG
ncbi:unnamed protein product [Clavelina lepadiformis]|uniref:G-protein coupled receptors family 1 profile domain-containing protein n=1 Tax=Clavelina lepadiformis TaxID=159417 RepID=A0ABP0G7T2_CLALP